MHLPLTLAQENIKPADSTISSTPANTESGTQVPADGAAPMGKQQDTNPFGGIMMLLPIMLAVMIFMTFRGQSKEKKKRAQLLSSLSKGDKVQTIGGIIGNVVEIRDNEVVIKIDENTNTKMKFARSAIQNKIEE